MALDLQQRPAQHRHRRRHTRYETENGRVVLQADPIKNGGITGPCFSGRNVSEKSNIAHVNSLLCVDCYLFRHKLICIDQVEADDSDRSCQPETFRKWLVSPTGNTRQKTSNLRGALLPIARTFSEHMRFENAGNVVPLRTGKPLQSES